MLAEFAYMGGAAARQVVIEDPNRIMATGGSDTAGSGWLLSPADRGASEEITDLAWKRAGSYVATLPELVKSASPKSCAPLPGTASAFFIPHRPQAGQEVKSGRLCSYSRSSVGSSLIAYLTGITEINPLGAPLFVPGLQIFGVRHQRG